MRPGGLAMRLDPEVLRQIREVGGAALLIELFETFLEHAPSRLATLRAAAAAGDEAALASAAHSMCSAAASLGATELAALAGRVERSARRERAGSSPEPLVELERAFAELVGELRLRVERERDS